MAILTALGADDVAAAASAFGIDVASSRGVLAGSVNTNYEVVDGRRQRWFLRLYEEQDARGAAREALLLATLADLGVRTPRPRRLANEEGFVAIVRGKPLACFPFVGGTHRCQKSVSISDAHAVGAALARVHLVGQSLDPSLGLTGPSRFAVGALRARLEGLEVSTLPSDVARAREELLPRIDRLEGWAPRAAPIPLVHGDLFRDNVLFEPSGDISLLDFESASIGGAAFDLAVTALAWCFGDDLGADLVDGMVGGYASVRRLAPEEVADIATSAQLACVRFATTRITDYELRLGGAGAGAGTGTYKDYRRWLRRLEVVERLFGLREVSPGISLAGVWPT